MVAIVARHRGDTWRAVYTVRFAEAVYVLHAFQKKSKRGIATPKKEMDLSANGWPMLNGCTGKGKTSVPDEVRRPTAEKTGAKRLGMEKSSGNVFADLGLPHPEQELLKAKLTLQIYRLIRSEASPKPKPERSWGSSSRTFRRLMRNRAGAFPWNASWTSSPPGAGRRDHRPAHAQAPRRGFCPDVRRVTQAIAP